MSAGSPGDDSGEPAPAEDPWSRSADFSQPGPTQPALSPQPAQPAPPQPAAQPPESEAFVSPTPAAWSAPVDWTPPAQSAQPVQSAPPDAQAPPTSPIQPPPPGPGAFAPPPRPGLTDPSASPLAGGNGFGPADPDPRTGQPLAPSPPAGPHGHPSAAYYSSATVRTSRVAIAALVCGLAQFFLGLFALNFLLAIPAIICGAIGMRHTRQRGESGRGLAIAGLVLGILGIVWNVLYVVLIVVLTDHGGASLSTP